jgi:hypothetical protein
MSVSEEQVRVVENDLLRNYGDGAIPIARRKEPLRAKVLAAWLGSS